MIYLPLSSLLSGRVIPGELVFAATHNHMKLCGDIERRLRPTLVVSERAASHASAFKVLLSSALGVHVFDRHRSAQTQRIPSATLRAEESAWPTSVQPRSVSRLKIPQIQAALLTLFFPFLPN